MTVNEFVASLSSAEQEARNTRITTVSPKFKLFLDVFMKEYKELSGNDFCPATDEDIAEVEEKLGFKLPEAYKCFVRYYSNGIFVLQETEEAFIDELYINGLDRIAETCGMDELTSYSFELYGDGYGNGEYWDAWTGYTFSFDHEEEDGNYPEELNETDNALEEKILGVLFDIFGVYDWDEHYENGNTDVKFYVTRLLESREERENNEIVNKWD